MRKFLKITTCVVVVFFAFALFVPTLFKGKISEIVKHEANSLLAAHLEFEALDLSLLRHFPHASVELTGLKLIGAEPFEGDTVVAAQRISVVVNLMSLFGNEGLEVSKIFLHRPEVMARKLDDGRVNWDLMKDPKEGDPQSEEGEQEVSQEETQQDPSEEPNASFRLQISDLTISEAVIRYRDDSLGVRFETNPLNLNLRGNLSADQTDLDLRLAAQKLHFEQRNVPLIHGTDLSLDAVVQADFVQQRFTFAKNSLKLNAVELALDGWVDLEPRSIKMDLKAGCEQVLFKDVLSLIPAFYTRQFNNLKAGGSLQMALWARGELSQNTLPQFELKTSVQDGYFQYAALPEAVSDIQLALKVSNQGGTMDQTEIDLSKFGLQMAGNRIGATLFAKRLASDPFVRFTTEGRLDLGAIHKVYPLDEDVSFEGRVAVDLLFEGSRSAIEKQRYEQLKASGRFVIEELGAKVPQLPEVKMHRVAATITPEAMTLGECDLSVGRSDLQANGQLSGYLGYLLRGELLTGRLYLKSSLIDLNELMQQGVETPDQTKAEGPNENVPNKDNEKQVMQCIEVPKNLDLKLSTDLKRILFQKMDLTNLGGEMRVAQGVLSLKDLRLTAFDGQAKASGSYSTASTNQKPELNLSAEFLGASFHKTFDQLEMVQQMVPIFSKTGGNYSLSMTLRTRFDEGMQPDLKSLTASGEIRSQNIQVENLKAFEVLADVLHDERLARVNARDVTIHFTIKDGRLATAPFDLNMGKLKINLSGTTGLDQSIDYVARVSLPKGSVGGVLQTVPVQIGGTFTNPQIKLGVKQAAEDALKNVLGEQLNDLTGGRITAKDAETRKQQIRDRAKTSGDKLLEAATKQRQSMIDKAASKGRAQQIIAQKAGDKLVREAEKQAAKLMEDAEAKIAQME